MKTISSIAADHSFQAITLFSVVGFAVSLALTMATGMDLTIASL
jgi:hypothetical protein